MWREWIHTLTIVLRNAVDAAGMLPAETPAERSGSSSGLLQRKKKKHTVKNAVITTLTGLVLFVEATVPGKTHDKTIA